MKIVARPIEMVAWFTIEGIPNPVRFRIKNDDGEMDVVKIEKIVFKEREKIAGNEMINYRCQSTISGQTKTLEIKYELSTCKWILFKI